MYAATPDFASRLIKSVVFIACGLCHGLPETRRAAEAAPSPISMSPQPLASYPRESVNERRHGDT
jgi:hypothetical protein